MKKVKLCVWCVGVVIAGVISSGCTSSAGGLLMNAGSPNCIIPNYIPSSHPGILYSNARRTTYLAKSKKEQKGYDVLGKVESTAYMSNALFLFNWGDSSYNTLYQKAISKYPAADDIIDVEIMSDNINICIFYMRTKSILHGTAIKYKK